MRKQIKSIVRKSFLLKVLLQNKPRYATFFFTRKCNLKCPTCNVSTSENSDIDISEWELIVKKLKKWGIVAINIVGGEPTLRKDLPDLLRCISDNRILSILHSNFSFIAKTDIDVFSSCNLGILQASVDETHKNVEDYPHIISLLKYASTKGIVPMISTLITANDVNEIDVLVDHITKEGIFFNIGLYQIINKSFSKNNERLLPSNADLKRAFSYLRRLKKSKHLIKTSYEFLSKSHLYPRRWKCSPDKDYWVIVDNNGHLMPCQEYSSPIHTLSINSLEDTSWREFAFQTRHNCEGCYHHCYYEAENLKGLKLIWELKENYKLLLQGLA